MRFSLLIVCALLVVPSFAVTADAQDGWRPATKKKQLSAPVHLASFRREVDDDGAAAEFRQASATRTLNLQPPRQLGTATQFGTATLSLASAPQTGDQLTSQANDQQTPATQQPVLPSRQTVYYAPQSAYATSGNCCVNTCQPAAYGTYYAGYGMMQPTTLQPTMMQPTTSSWTSWRPVLDITPPASQQYIGQGILGQPKIYVPGQPLRNLLRYISP